MGKLLIGLATVAWVFGLAPLASAQPTPGACHAAGSTAAATCRIRVYTGTNPTPIVVYDFPATASSCNLAKLTNPSNVNPTRLRWDDPANPTTRECEHLLPVGSPIRTLGTASYEGTIAGISVNGTEGPEGSRTPFVMEGLPGAVSGFRVVR